MTTCTPEERAVLDALTKAETMVHMIGNEKNVALCFSAAKHAKKFFDMTKRWKRIRRHNALDMAIDLNAKRASTPPPAEEQER